MTLQQAVWRDAWQGFDPAEDGVMWNPASSTRSAMVFLMAAAIAFVGSAGLLKAGRGVPQQTGVAMAAPPEALLLVVVILLGVSGVLLVAMAGNELLDVRRRGPSVR